MRTQTALRLALCRIHAVPNMPCLYRRDATCSGLRSESDDAVIDHQPTPFADHVAAYLEHHRNRGSSENTIEGITIRLKKLERDCQLVRLSDLNTEKIQNWLTLSRDSGMAPRTRNSYLEVAKAFANWCVKNRRLLENPLADISKAEQTSDRRLVRRALTPAELERLFYVIRWRPLAERGRESIASKTPNGRKTWKLKPLAMETLPASLERAHEKLTDKPEIIAELVAIGRERELAIKTFLLTGLRRNELRSLKVGTLVLDSAIPYLVLEAANAKNRKRTEIPLRSDLAKELTEWVDDRRNVLSGHSGVSEGVLSLAAARGVQLPLDTPLFPNISQQFVKVLDRDLAAAGIPKRDERGRSIDVHALRHTYCSLLSAGGVAPRTAQAAMRHSSIDLTMNVYTDPRVLDVAGALDSLPSLNTGCFSK